MVRRGHIPLRMCSGCGNRFAKAELVRFTVHETAAGRSLILDTALDGSKDANAVGGRGGYVCPEADCLKRALDRKTLLRRLKATDESLGLRDEFARLIEARKQ